MKTTIMVLAVLLVFLIGCSGDKIINPITQEISSWFEVGETYPIVTYSGINPADTVLARVMNVEYTPDSVWHSIEFAGDSGEVFLIFNPKER